MLILTYWLIGLFFVLGYAVHVQLRLSQGDERIEALQARAWKPLGVGQRILLVLMYSLLWLPVISYLLIRLISNRA
ncbi:hypothetical protein C8P63_1433 [Melghirimyces profundicolus]|uniref:Uncharacterized protein n=1 Tax=Melghirimyces profundicolus TaxID=1242148 RepID=A0A2T6AYJ9_9BACL|nr:hypothetical protein [Melghirimyces profundicolus]PTX48882.1 hypothetical protein C8P63_1433 [Melghirimyces profundicolus]